MSSQRYHPKGNTRDDSFFLCFNVVLQSLFTTKGIFRLALTSHLTLLTTEYPISYTTTTLVWVIPGSKGTGWVLSREVEEGRKDYRGLRHREGSHQVPYSRYESRSPFKTNSVGTLKGLTKSLSVHWVKTGYFSSFRWHPSKTLCQRTRILSPCPSLSRRMSTTAQTYTTRFHRRYNESPLPFGLCPNPFHSS